MRIALEILIYTVLVALASAFSIQLLKKWKVIEWLQVHGNDLISKMASCSFCLSFWTSLIISSALAYYTCDYELMIVPVFSTSITRLII